MEVAPPCGWGEALQLCCATKPAACPEAPHLSHHHLLLVVAHPLAITTAHPLAIAAAVSLIIACARAELALAEQAQSPQLPTGLG